MKEINLTINIYDDWYYAVKGGYDTITKIARQAGSFAVKRYDCGIGDDSRKVRNICNIYQIHKRGETQARN